MTFKTFGILGFRVFAYNLFLSPTTSLRVGTPYSTCNRGITVRALLRLKKQ